jgi:endonuclease/exonuclease/phosphatase family metal-dependent hydrolase
MKRIIRLLLIVLALPLIYLSIVILIGTITRYKPLDIEQISKIDEEFYLSDSTIYSVMIWNIGYAGLGSEMDFFYDGGKKVRDTEDNVRRNIYKISEFLQANDTLDFILLQEVDENSKRCYQANLVEHFNMSMADYFPFYTTNYKVKFVPMPFFKPIGRVVSGLLTLTRHIPVETIRYALPGNYAWPKNIFLLNRCFLLNRFKLEGGKELLLINTHNSAYDDGTLRLEQMNFLKSFLLEEEKNGNAFIVGGDWNQCPNNFQPNFKNQILDTTNVSYVDEDFMQAGWKWSYDNTTPTNRSVATSYIKGETPVSLIDFFLTSSNIEVLSCRTIDLQFAYSDHQPVLLTFKLK